MCSVRAGGVDIKEMLKPSKLTARLVEEGLHPDGAESAHVTSTETQPFEN